MKSFALALLRRSLWLTVATSFICSLNTSAAKAQSHELHKKIDIQHRLSPMQLGPVEQNTQSYILGPGDSVLVELHDVPEYSGVFNIGPDGTLYIPRLRALQAEGLTVAELRDSLTKRFSSYVRSPQVYVTPAGYRPIRVFVGGEVARPGYYYLSGLRSVPHLLNQNLAKGQQNPNGVGTNISNEPMRIIGGVSINSELRQPTVFDALRTAGGVTPFSKLSEVVITRKRSISSGGGKMRTTVYFLELITEGNETQNIRLFDGDNIVLGRSKIALREQVIKAGQTNLSPDFLRVYVTGRVRDPGIKTLPQGASLDQAIAAAGGQRLLRGQVEFIRFNRDGSTDRRKFFLGSSNPAGSYKNPILIAGDVLRVNDSPISAGVTILNEITGPAVGIYSVYSLFNDFL